MGAAFDISVDLAANQLVLRGAALSAAAPWEKIRSLLERLLSVPGITSLNVDRLRSTIKVALPARADRALQQSLATRVLRSLAEGLRRRTDPTAISEAYGSLHAFGLTKVDEDVVGGWVETLALKRTRLRHPLLQQLPTLSAFLIPLLANQAGVEQVTVKPSEGTIQITHQANITACQLLKEVEQIIRQAGVMAVPDHAARRLAVSGGCLALAVAAEFLGPGLAPVVGGLLVMSNLSTLGRGLWELVTLRWRLPALYTVIMSVTLVTGQVLAASLMQVSIAGWYWWSNRRLRQMISHLLADAAARSQASPMRLQAETDGATESRPVCRTQLSPLGTELLSWLGRTSSSHKPTHESHSRAGRFVPWTFATGAAAIATNDVTALAAVLRPDFATGPSIAERISQISGLQRLLDRGWMVQHPEALDRLMSASLIIVAEVPGDVNSPAERSAAEPFLQVQSVDWPLQNAERTVKALKISGPVRQCTEVIDRLSSTRETVAVCGPAIVTATLRSKSVITIVKHDQRAPVGAPGHIAALPGHGSWSELWDEIVSHRLRLRSIWPIVCVCNVVSVVGAFAVGLTSLHVIGLTNLGTWAAYSCISIPAGRSSRLVRNKRLTDRSARHVQNSPGTQLDRERLPPRLQLNPAFKDSNSSPSGMALRQDPVLK